jgi:hypothetical protein
VLQLAGPIEHNLDRRVSSFDQVVEDEPLAVSRHSVIISRGVDYSYASDNKALGVSCSNVEPSLP